MQVITVATKVTTKRIDTVMILVKVAVGSATKAPAAKAKAKEKIKKTKYINFSMVVFVMALSAVDFDSAKIDKKSIPHTKKAFIFAI